MAADSWETLMAKVNKKLEKQMSGPVAKRVEKQLQKNAKSIATGPASRPSNGISDPSNIVSEIKTKGNDIELHTKDIAKPNDWSDRHPWAQPYDASKDTFGTVFSEWVNDGLWEQWPPGSHEPRPEREFITKTQEDVNGPLKQQIIADLKKGFK